MRVGDTYIEEQNEDWERQWDNTSIREREVYRLIEECIDEAVPDANGTNEFVVLEFARRIAALQGE